MRRAAPEPEPVSPANLPPTVVVDARGQRCPLPVIHLARRVRESEPGTTVSVLADDPAAAADIPAWCRLTGSEFLGAEPAYGGGTAYLVRRRVISA